jgi:hypothetical protein
MFWKTQTPIYHIHEFIFIFESTVQCSSWMQNPGTNKIQKTQQKIQQDNHHLLVHGLTMCSVPSHRSNSMQIYIWFTSNLCNGSTEEWTKNKNLPTTKQNNETRMRMPTDRLSDVHTTISSSIHYYLYATNIYISALDMHVMAPMSR